VGVVENRVAEMGTRASGAAEPLAGCPTRGTAGVSGRRPPRPDNVDVDLWAAVGIGSSCERLGLLETTGTLRDVALPVVGWLQRLTTKRVGPMKEVDMRVLMKVQIPTAAGNAAIKDGSLPQIVGKVIDAVKAEAAYFTAEDGMRTALIFFDMADSSAIPPAAEPFFMGLDAKITFAPVMNADEMRAGVGKAVEAM
jgi:hypothetical protein